MKIRHLIVTYKQKDLLNQQLGTIFARPLNHDYHLCILNNHPDFSLAPQFSHVQVIHNLTRHPNSLGHLAKDWNTGLILGFEDLRNLACDIVILSQDDVYFNPDWLDKIVELHKKYEFVTYGQGDAVTSYSPQHIIKVGLWDECFPSCGVSEGDYFARSRNRNPDKSSINDHFHGRRHNVVEHDVITQIPCGIERVNTDQSKKIQIIVAAQYEQTKWGPGETWSKTHVPKQYIMHPFFEQHIDQRNYINPMPQPTYVLGNSHANLFTNTYPSEIGVSKERGGFISVAIGAGLAWKFQEKHIQHVYNLPIGSKVILAIGEIDCRVHIPKQAVLQNRDPLDVCKECVDKYFQSLLILRRDYDIIAWGNHPTTGEHEDNQNCPRYGDLKTRNKVSKFWSDYLGQLCAAENIPFVSILDDLLNEDGTTKAEYYEDYTHLSYEKTMPLIKEKLKNVGL